MSSELIFQCLVGVAIRSRKRRSYSALISPRPASWKIARAPRSAQRGPNGSVSSDKAMSRRDAWRMIGRGAKAAGIAAPICNHTFRATGIAAYLSNGGALEHAQEMAAHESPRTTKLYDRTTERLSQDEVERIRF
jgi:hypothetical protein